MASILVVDDERSMREFLSILLAKEGHEVVSEGEAVEAIARASASAFDVVVTDLRLGRDSGLDVLRAVKSASPSTEVVVITAYATAENAVHAMKAGAYDYVLKPFKVDELKLVVEKALEHRSLLAENRVLRHRAGVERDPTDIIVGNTPAMAEVRKVMEKVASTRTTVLITGESGTGKEVVARTIHARGNRRGDPFVAVNCGAVPEGLIESEFFGHERGSFTGAAETKLGLFEVAGSGTLFLDEVGELSPTVQVKLLRALQERKMRRVGGAKDIPIGARIMAATNRDLAQDVAAGRFREDLYYRLNVIHLGVPPLRERLDDLPMLTDHFLALFCAEMGRPRVSLSSAALERLRAHSWPGNIRELANVLERAVALVDGDVVGPEVLPPPLRGDGVPPLRGPASEVPPDGIDLQAHLDAIERAMLEQALQRSDGVKTEAAHLLRLTFRSLRYRLAKFGLGGR